MIGTLPASKLAPLDYRYALDAAMTLLPATAPPLLCCNAPALEAEVRQRIPQRATRHKATAALWIEPLHTTWRADLRRLSRSLAPGGTLVIVASQPLARLVPERRAWSEQPLGMRVRGLAPLWQTLRLAGFTLDRPHGMHSLHSIMMHMLSRQCERWGRPDLGDRLHFAARLQYRVHGPWATFATVTLRVARKDRPLC